MNRVIAPLQHAMGIVNIDPARVYMVGYAMSAYSAWDLALHQPTYFTAFDALAGPVSGDWQRLRVMNLRNVLPLVWHDTDDEVVRVAIARSLVDSLRRMKCDVVYEETQHVGNHPRF
jgi:predicted peptidase